MISDPKNEYNWKGVQDHMNAYSDDYTYTIEDLGLTKFPEAKENKMLLYVFPSNDSKDSEIFMSKKSGKAISYDYKNRYTVRDITEYIKYYDRRDYDDEIDEEKVKSIWNEIK